MRLRETKPRKREIEMIGMINVIFLLLIFFLIAGTIAPKAPAFLELSALAEGEDRRPPASALALDVDGAWHHQGETVGPEMLAELLQGNEDEGPQEIYVDRRLSAGLLAERIGELATAGASSVRIVTLGGGP